MRQISAFSPLGNQDFAETTIFRERIETNEELPHPVHLHRQQPDHPDHRARLRPHGRDDHGQLGLRRRLRDHRPQERQEFPAHAEAPQRDQRDRAHHAPVGRQPEAADEVLVLLQPGEREDPADRRHLPRG